MGKRLKRLYLIEARARAHYTCASCHAALSPGASYFRHDPFPMARYRGEQVTHWCRRCILAAGPGPQDPHTGRIRVPAVEVVPAPDLHYDPDPQQLKLFEPLRVELIPVETTLYEHIVHEPALIHALTLDQFEELICDRLFAMGFEPKMSGSTYRKDGGIDILFWSRLPCAFPFLGAVQVKHHRDVRRTEGAKTVREFAGAISGHPFNAGIIVTNTSFSPDAQWFAREHAKLIRLRDFEDIRRWLYGRFSDEAEWREIPSSLELCPGVTVRIR